MSVKNPFIGRRVAGRYARARPGLHDRVVDLILARQSRARRAIDLACGTGLSATPLLSVAQHVVGVDVSRDMLAAASREQRVSYVQAAAERLPFGGATFDLATVCSGIHWFERDALVELHRILRVRGTLVIYDVWFPAHMVDEPRFSRWMCDVCAPRYASVPKNHDNVKALQGIGFLQTWAADARYEVPMDLRSLVEYIMTHSERIAAIQDGRETEPEQDRFLTDGLRALFRYETHRVVEFGIWVRAFRR